MIYFRSLSRLQLMITGLIGSFLLFFPNAQAQNVPKKEAISDSTTSYLLDNFKCSLEMGGMTNLDSKTLQGGLSFGYYLYKYDRTQKGVFRGGRRSGKRVLVNAGKSILSLETGINYAKNYLSKLSAPHQIEEKLIVIPITLQLAQPDYFFNGIYDIFFLGYNVKSLLGSYELHEEHKKLMPISVKNGASLFHSLSAGFGLLAPFGLYGTVGIDLPLNPPNDFDSYHTEPQRDNIFGKRDRSLSFCFRLGFDITMLLRKLYGMSFQEGPLIVDSPYVSPQSP